MSNKFKDAFLFALNLGNPRTMKMYRAGGEEKDIKVSNSNYSANIAIKESIVAPGREYVVTVEAVVATGYGTVKRQDKFIDAQLGTGTVSHVEELILMGELVGYRIRMG